ncbi:hypothetical protein BGW39_003900 [Mortierella sp. 14UC]|nr:hypothetical protein BGW39_003900 [Mortierella sp. 14UC]
MPPTISDNNVEQLSEEREVDPTSNESSNTPATPPVTLSDEARFLILNRYGGMYLDTDVLLLRDMSPFYDAKMEFAYEWSNTLMYNTAAQGQQRRSSDPGWCHRKGEGNSRKKLREAMKGGESVKVKITKDGETGVDPLRLEKIPDRDDYKDKKRVRGGKPKAVKQSQSTPELPSASVVPLPIAAAVVNSSAGGQARYNSGEDDSLGSSDGDSLSLQLLSTPLLLVPLHAVTIITIVVTCSSEMRPNEIYHPARLRGYLRLQDSAIENNGLTMMPVAVFDPLWLQVDDAESKVGQTTDRELTVEDLPTFPDALSSASNSVCPQQEQQQQEQGEGEGKEMKGFMAGPEVFAMGAYAYHWHNNWLTPIEAQSWMGLMEAHAQFLAGERPNLYGEWFRGDSIAFLF